jgi:hypothetical protein
MTLGCGSASAQTGMDVWLGPTWAMEDMALLSAPGLGKNRMGVYFWTPPDVHYFTSTMERVADAAAPGGVGYVGFVISHPEKIYHPVGVSFGSDANGKPWSIDMSAPGGDSVSIEIENVSTQALKVRITLKDVDENMVDTKAETPVESPWNGPYEFSLAPKTTVKKAFAYGGGYYAQYSKASMDRCNLFADSTAKSVPCGEQHIDMTRIAGANITVNSKSPETLGIDKAEVRIRRMSFGRGGPSTAVAPRRIAPRLGMEAEAFLRGKVLFPRGADAAGRLAPVRVGR